MQINWFTVIAQMVNFLILVWLMKKYLYTPILKAVDEREKKIAASLADAKSKKAEAKSEQDEFKKKNDAFDLHKMQMMDQATTDAGKERQNLLDVAKNEAAAMKTKLEEASKEWQESMNDQFSQKIQDEVFSITKKALNEMASTNLEEQAIHVFIRNIKAMKENDKRQFIDAFHSNSGPLSIRSAFKLSEKEQKNIRMSVDELLGPDVKYSFETDSDNIAGIEMVTKGYKLSWSLEAYVNSLEKSLASGAKEPLKETNK